MPPQKKCHLDWNVGEVAGGTIFTRSLEGSEAFPFIHGSELGSAGLQVKEGFLEFIIL